MIHHIGGTVAQTKPGLGLDIVASRYRCRFRRGIRRFEGTLVEKARVALTMLKLNKGAYIDIIIFIR